MKGIAHAVGDLCTSVSESDTDGSWLLTLWWWCCTDDYDRERVGSRKGKVPR